MEKIIAGLEVLDEKEVNDLNNGVLEVLETVGMRYESNTILKALEAFGAKVNFDEKIARFPTKVVEKIVSAKKRKSIIAIEENLTPSMGLTIEPSYYDFDKKERKRATRDDFIMLIKFGEAMNDFFKMDKRVSAPVYMSDIKREIESFEALELLFKYVRKPGPVYPYFVEQMPYLAKIGDIYAGDSTYFLGSGWLGITSPLIMGEHTAKVLIKNLEYGVQSRIGTMVIAGGNAPVTIAGTIILASAEIIGGWAAILSLKPETPLAGSVITGTMDMKTTKSCISSPEAILQNIGTRELFEKCYGGGIGIGSQGYIDAKVPGIQAVFEKTSKLLLSFVSSNLPFMLANGELDAGQVYSPVELLLEHELGTQLYRYNKGIEVDKESMGLEVIKEVGIGKGKNYLDTEHTLRNYKALWMPSFLDRTAYSTDEIENKKEKELLHQANEKFKLILNSYKPPTVDENIVREVQKVIKEAKGSLQG